jgi:hypothetical protein
LVTSAGPFSAVDVSKVLRVDAGVLDYVACAAAHKLDSHCSSSPQHPKSQERLSSTGEESRTHLGHCSGVIAQYSVRTAHPLECPRVPCYDPD